MRGTLFPVEKSIIADKITDDFGMFIDDIPMVNKDELYAGKICAALSRQHPRDLFDVKFLFEATGITESMKNAFIIYLACSPKPMHELLAPNMIDIKDVFEKEFKEMTDYHVELDELMNVRELLIKNINDMLTDSDAYSHHVDHDYHMSIMQLHDVDHKTAVM